MSGGKGSKKSTSTQSSRQTISPPSYLADDLSFITDEARRLYDLGYPDYYGGDTVANFTPEQLEAFDATLLRAREGSPLIDQSQQFVTDLVSGEYMENPYLQDYIDTLGQRAINQVNQSFNASGRLGSGSNMATGATAVTEAQLPFLLQQYNTGINQRLAAADRAIPLANQDYFDISKIAAVGEANQMQNQREIDADMQRYFYNAFAPQMALQDYANLIYSSPGNQHVTTTGESTTTSRQSGGGGSLLGNVLGAGLSLAGMGFNPLGGFSSILGGMGGMPGAFGFGMSTGGQGGLGALANGFGAISGRYGPGF